MKKSGFTVVELTMIILIVGILTTLAGVQVLRVQLVGRDKERTDDINSIAIFLEDTYKTGQPNGVVIPPGDGNTTATPLGYPSTALISNQNDTQSQAILGAIDPQALKSPLKKAFSLTAAANNTNIAGTAITNPNNNDNYIYQPLKSDGTLCTLANNSNVNQAVIAPRLDDSCVKFRIFYVSEVKGVWQVKNSLFSNTNGL